MFAVGIKGAKTAELANIAQQNTDRYFVVSDFDKLTLEMMGRIGKVICDAEAVN